MKKTGSGRGARQRGTDRLVEELHIHEIEMRLARNRCRLQHIIEETEAYIARGDAAAPAHLPSLIPNPRKSNARHREAR
jgi:hypothetical protein